MKRDPARYAGGGRAPASLGRRLARTLQWAGETAPGALLALAALGVLMTGKPALVSRLEMLTYDWRARITASDARHPVIELVVDDTPRPWPPPRDVLAQCVERLARAGAKTIALETSLKPREVDRVLDRMKRLLDSLRPQGMAEDGPQRAIYRELAHAVAELDHDRRLLETLARAGNVVLPVGLEPVSGRWTASVPEALDRHLLHGAPPSPTETVWAVEAPPKALAAAARGLGHLRLVPDHDGVLRRPPPRVPVRDGRKIPSLALAIALAQADGGQREGSRSALEARPQAPGIESAPQSRVPGPGTWIRWHRAAGRSFHRTPLSRVLNMETETSPFKDKIVLVGAVRGPGTVRLKTPVASGMPRIEVIAHALANILDREKIHRPSWCSGAEIVAVALMAIWVSLALPRLTLLGGAVTTAVLCTAWLLLSLAAYERYGIWVKTAVPAGLALCGGAWVAGRRTLLHLLPVPEHRPKRRRGPSAASTLSVAELSLLPLEARGVREALYETALRHEALAQWDQALQAYRLIGSPGRRFHDVPARIRAAEERLRSPSKAPEEGDPGRAGNSTPALERLGPYEVGGTRWREGDAVVVAQGRDCRDGRRVWIRLGPQEAFEGRRMTETAIERLERVRGLVHPNILCLLDYGIAEGYAYVVTEFPSGRVLRRRLDPGDPLPLGFSLKVASRVAQALDFAHARGLVHGNLRPDLISCSPQGTRVKVGGFERADTLFGPAGLKDGFMEYMSPEMIAGRNLDGRSDVFSLGVMLYRMVCGRKPFEAGEPETLALKIVKEPHVPPGQGKVTVAVEVAALLDRLLEKDPEKRMDAAALGRFLDTLLVERSVVPEETAEPSGWGMDAEGPP